MIDDGTGHLTIGEPARATGLTVRTSVTGPTRAPGDPEAADVLRDLRPPAAHRAEFAWVAAAMRAHLAS